MPPHPAAPAAPDILIVEDSPTQAESLRALLAAHGYRARVADDGRRALEAMHRQPPDLVLSDILMPEMDGYALCAAIKRDPALGDIPVVLVTSLIDPTDIVRGLEAGADNFIRKPYSRDYLLQRIGEIVESGRSRREQGGAADGRASGASGEEVALFLGGQRHQIQVRPQQMLDLLVSTYEQAVSMNGQLQARERQVNELNARLAQHASRLEATNREIARQNGELEQANRLKSEFLANMSHELRTPLNAVIGLSDALRGALLGALTPQQEEAAGDILDSGRHLLTLINDILDLSKVEAGRMELTLETTELQSLLQGVLNAFRQKALAGGIRLRLELEALGPVQVDQHKARQIVYNLVSNALKFTPSGGAVTVRMYRADEADMDGQYMPRETRLAPGPYLVLSVIDSGIGIEQGDLSRLFQPFVQLDGASTRKYEGTGLGLAIVRQFAQLHGGAVSVATTPGKGSVFTVWLPYMPADEQGAAGDASSQGRDGTGFPAFGTR